jgi:hypothetical protein
MEEYEQQELNVDSDQLLQLAEQADDAEAIQQVEISGDFSLERINKLVDALNRVNKVFQAPPYPAFEASPEIFPPEFVSNLEMVQAAVSASGLDDYAFELTEIADDEDLKMLAGKLDAMASDKSFRSFLNKPLGTGELQQEAGIPTVLTKGTEAAVQPNQLDIDELMSSRLA